MRKTREEKAITLIALIITIVVLLILAVVAINAVTGDGIIQHAVNAKTEYEKAQDKEEDMLSYYEGVLQSGEVVPTVEQLQENYKFEYYNSLSDAIKKVNGKTVTTVSKENAVSGIYQTDGKTSVVLLKDTTERAKIIISKDLTLNLGGKTLNFTSLGIDTVKNNGNTIEIDGRLQGSKISCIGSGNSALAAVQVRAGNNLTINGGSLKAENEASTAYGINILSSEANPSIIKILNCTIDTSSGLEIEKTSLTSGIYIGSNNKVTINNSQISVTSTASVQGINIGVYGINNNGNSEVSIKNSNIFTDAAGSSAEEPNSTGIVNWGTMNITYSYVYGTHSGMRTGAGSKTYVTGGTFESPSHGGFYFIHGAAGEAYIEGAKIAKCEYKGQFGSIHIGGNGGLYIGGETDEMNHMTVNFNNCEITNPSGPAIVLSSTYGGTDNRVRISNSTVSLAAKIRIDDDTHSIYYSNCNFDKDDTNRPDRVVEEINQTYVKK